MTNCTHTIALLGLKGRERQALDRIFALSVKREHAYEVVHPRPGCVPDLLVVDGSDAAAARVLSGLRVNGMHVPTLIIDGAAAESHERTVSRPLMAMRILNALDELATRANASGTARPEDTQADEPDPAATVPDSGPVPANRAAGSYAQATLTETPEVPQRAGATLTERPARPRRADTTLTEAPAPATTFRALVVDDSAPVRTQVSLELDRIGVNVAAAESGERALELLEGNEFDIVFLDVVMTGIDGYEVCKRIKRRRDRSPCPVVMLTGKSSPFDKVKGRLSGCDAYLSKPVSRSEFDRTVDKFLKPAFSAGEGGALPDSAAAP